MKKVLVTGGAGFIGSHLVEALLAQGDEVHVIDNFSTGRKENLTVHPNLHIIQRTLEELGSYEIEQLPEFTHVFHLAARARVQPSIKDPLQTDKSNVHGTLVALEIARRHMSHFIFSSSSSIYGDHDKMPLEVGYPPRPASPYALTKLIGEQYCRLYFELYKLPTTALRYFNVYGERQLTEGAYCNAIGIFLGLRAQGKPLQITGDGEQRRDFTYVKDVVAANLLMADFNHLGIFNVGRGSNASVNEIAAAVGADYPKEYIDARPGECRITLADNSQLRSLGWEPTMEVLEWIKKQV